MALVEIKINGRFYKLSCADDEQDNIKLVGEQLNQMASEITSAMGNVNESLLLVMLAVLAKDEANHSKTNSVQNDEGMNIILEKVATISKKLENINQ